MPCVMDWFAENEKGDLWFRGPQGECYFFPKGWAQEFRQPGFAFDRDELELYGYLPDGYGSVSSIYTGWFPVRLVEEEKLVEVTEADARASHPSLAEYLDALNDGTVAAGDVDGRFMVFESESAMVEMPISGTSRPGLRLASIWTSVKDRGRERDSANSRTTSS